MPRWYRAQKRVCDEFGGARGERNYGPDVIGGCYGGRCYDWGEVKRWRSPVHAGAVRDTWDKYGSGGFMASRSGFTSGAIEEARRLGVDTYTFDGEFGIERIR